MTAAPGAASRRSLARRLVLLAAGWSLLVLVVAGAALTWAFFNAAYRELNASLAEQIKNIQRVIEADANGVVLTPQLTDDRLKGSFSGRYWLIYEPVGQNGWRELARSVSMGDADPLPPPPGGLDAITQKIPNSLTYEAPGPNHQHLRVAAQENYIPHRAAPVVIVAAEDTSAIRADVRAFLLIAAGVLLLLGAGLVVAVMVQVRIGLRPLFALRREIELVRKGQETHLAGHYPVELSPLADELNALMAHNQEVVERQRTHVGNLAHALKTPLSVMSAEAQRTPGPLADLVERQSGLMRAQVDHHLRRARAAARSGGGEATPLAPVLDELARTLERIFRDKAVEIDWLCDDDLAFHGERQDLLELAGNVIENAAKFCRRRVRVEAVAEPREKLSLTVEDDGPGLPAERRAEVMRRGARLDESAPGSGLGLSIVEDLATAYGGSVKLDDSSLGGLKVTLRLPRV